jgi:hypothetical protein
MARSSTSCCRCSVTWRPRGASARGRCTRALRAGTVPAEVTTDGAPVCPRVLDELIPSACTAQAVREQPDRGRLEVFAKGPHGNLGHTWQNTPGGSWCPWTDLGPAITSSLAVAANKAGT